VTLPSDWQAQIEEAQRLRGWLVNAFAQVEYVLGDLILRCRAFPEYEEHTRSLPHGAAARIAKLRLMLPLHGPLRQDAPELGAVLDQLSGLQDTRNLLVHGFATVLHTPLGEVGFHFQKFHRVPGRQDARLIRTITLTQLQLERDSHAAFATSTIALFARIHARLGWIGPLAEDYGVNEPFRMPS
jgi:hypothetical protein